MTAREQKKPNHLLRQQRRLRGWSLPEVVRQLQLLFPDDVCAVSADMIGKWELGRYTPSPFYQAKLCTLYGMTAAQLGFIEELSSPASSSPSSQESEIGEKHTALQATTTQQLLQLPLTKLDRSENTAMDRRRFIFDSVVIVGNTYLTSIEDLPVVLEQFSRVLRKPSSIDERTLRYLNKQTQRYWQDRHSASLPSPDLLGFVLQHLQRIAALLESSLYPTTRLHLCSIASKTSLLIGELLLDMGYYPQARDFQKEAILAAQEASNRVLEAISWGRLSLAWIYSENIQVALTCVQQARCLSSPQTLADAWLAAIEAEIQAKQNNQNACLKALDEAEHIEDQDYLAEDSYLIHFDRSLLGGYQGACYRQLYHPEDTQSHTYLEKAQQVLLGALNSLDPALIQRQSTFLTDLAHTYFEQGEVEETCQQALQAIAAASQIKLQKVIQRLLTLRQNLEPWKSTSYVKAFDEHMAPLLHSRGL